MAVSRSLIAATTQLDLRPGTDPFLCSSAASFANPEWLGDVLLYGLHGAGGELALIGMRIALVAIGSLLLLAAARRGGATTVTATLLVCVWLMTTGLRWVERNELHVVWLVPSYLLVLQSKRRHAHWALLPLGLVWANVHGSSVIGWVLVLAFACDAWRAGASNRSC